MTFADEIKRRVTVKQLCDALDIQVNRSGFAYCPFHADRKGRSLRVYDGPPSSFFCYGCQKGGSVIDFAMAYYGIDYRQAVARLDDLFDLGLPLTRRLTAQERRAAEAERKRQAEQREAEQAERNAREAAFWACFDRYLALRQVIDREKPRGLNEPITGLYANALWELPIAKDEYERAQDALLEIMEARKHAGASEPTAGGTDKALDQGGLPERRCAV